MKQTLRIVALSFFAAGLLLSQPVARANHSGSVVKITSQSPTGPYPQCDPNNPQCTEPTPPLTQLEIHGN